MTMFEKSIMIDEKHTIEVIIHFSHFWLYRCVVCMRRLKFISLFLHCCPTENHSKTYIRLSDIVVIHMLWLSVYCIL